MSLLMLCLFLSIFPCRAVVEPEKALGKLLTQNYRGQNCSLDGNIDTKFGYVGKVANCAEIPGTTVPLIYGTVTLSFMLLLPGASN